MVRTISAAGGSCAMWATSSSDLQIRANGHRKFSERWLGRGSIGDRRGSGFFPPLPLDGLVDEAAEALGRAQHIEAVQMPTRPSRADRREARAPTRPRTRRWPAPTRTWSPAVTTPSTQPVPARPPTPPGPSTATNIAPRPPPAMPPRADASIGGRTNTSPCGLPRWWLLSFPTPASSGRRSDEECADEGVLGDGREGREDVAWGVGERQGGAA